jgi:hypothetical protein
MPDEVKVSKAELLVILRENRSKHRDTFLEAQKKYRERVIEELERSLADARSGNDIRRDIRLPVPEDHTSDYDREIRMLEMEVEDTILIPSHQFDWFVMDKWSWSPSFAANTVGYTMQRP